MVVYKVLSIYRFLPGFREFAVFEKSKRFFYIFFGWVLHRGGQGPGKGPNLTQNKMNLFVLSGHGSESFAAFFNGVILQKNNAAVITTAVITTHHESKLRLK